MVCPNCHSDNIIEVQGQHFCINCGQALPQTAIEANGVQADGLPLGVKILPTSGIPEATRAGAAGTAVAAAPTKTAKATKTPAPKDHEPNPTIATESASDNSGTPLIVKSRSRIKDTDTPETETEDKSPESKASTQPEATTKPEPATEPKEAPESAQPKKRKPGRPKAGRLDAPRTSVASTAPALPDAPQLGRPKPAVPAPVPAPVPSPPAPDAPLVGPRRMSDIAVRKATRKPATKPSSHTHSQSKLIQIEEKAKPDAKAEHPAKPEPKSKNHRKRKALFTWPKHQAKRHHVHKVGAPSLHFGAVIKFSVRSAVRRRHVGLASLAAVSFAAAVGYGLWLFLNEGPNRLATGFQHLAPTLLAQLAGLAALYYVGRSIGQAALTYGVAREADQRPVPLSKQLGVGVNTFGRHLTMDLFYAIIQLGLLGVLGLLVVTGGQTWPVDIQWQMGALFVAFLLLLYLLAAMAITRGLAGVAITLTSHRPKTAIKLGWRLFSHRFELLGLRFLAAAVELLVALPLAALAIAFVAAAPAGLHLAVTLGVTVIAWLAGALIGAGTAAWWAALYRQLVLADHPDGAVNLLSSRQPTEANRGPLALIVSVSTLLVVVILVLPWVHL